MNAMPLKDLALILDISKSVACRLRAGEYTKNPLLTKRYETLFAHFKAQKTGDLTQEICEACPRQSCAGCRIAEI